MLHSWYHKLAGSQSNRPAAATLSDPDPVMRTTLPLRSEIMSIPSLEIRQRIAKGVARSLEAYLKTSP